MAKAITPPVEMVSRPKRLQSSLAKHKASMAIFLSIQNIKEAVKKLLTGYEKNTPAAVIYKATWKEQKIIFGTLLDIADKVRKEDIKKSAIILVGDFLGNLMPRRPVRAEDRARAAGGRRPGGRAGAFAGDTAVRLGGQGAPRSPGVQRGHLHLAGFRVSFGIPDRLPY